MHAGVLGTWPVTAGIEKEEEQWREEEWNTGKEGSRTISNRLDI